MLGWRRNHTSPSKYRNVLKHLGQYQQQQQQQQQQQSGGSGTQGRTDITVKPISVTPRALGSDPGLDADSHIDRLLVTGRGYEAANALELVKHRLDSNSTVCLMTDGLGVLEEVRQRFFATGAVDSTSSSADTNTNTNTTNSGSPGFILGHMSHRLAFNRAYDAVRQLRGGQTKLTPVDMSRIRDTDRIEARLNFVRTLCEAKDLRSSLTAYDQWLRFKLPSVVFESVVEPICVLLELPYEGLLQNPAARRMMHGLLSEIVLVVGNLPEVEGSLAVRDYVRGNTMKRLLYSHIMAKRAQPSELARRIENGLPTDVEYLNGYFLRRARKLGIDLPMNTMMRDMIKAKHSMAVERLNSFIPVEETSIPSESSFRYRTTAR